MPFSSFHGSSKGPSTSDLADRSSSIVTPPSPTMQPPGHRPRVIEDPPVQNCKISHTAKNPLYVLPETQSPANGTPTKKRTVRFTVDDYHLQTINSLNSTLKDIPSDTEPGSDEPSPKNRQCGNARSVSAVSTLLASARRHAERATTSSAISNRRGRVIQTMNSIDALDDAFRLYLRQLLGAISVDPAEDTIPDTPSIDGLFGIPSYPPLKADLWESNDFPDCSLCASTFSLLNRRHHCRLCGILICGTCCASSDEMSDLPGLEDLGKFPVCSPCVLRLYHVVLCHTLKNYASRLLTPTQPLSLEPEMASAQMAEAGGIIDLHDSALVDDSSVLCSQNSNLHWISQLAEAVKPDVSLAEKENI